MPDTPQTAATTTLRLRALPAGAAGRALCLRAGDILVAVNGRPFAGDAAALAKRFAARRGQALALGFRRGDQVLTVLADDPAPGQWEVIPAPPPEEGLARIDPDLVRNWEILRAIDGTYDLHPLRPSLLALLAPPLWLLQMRLWVPFATLVTALAAGALVALWVPLLVWGASVLHIRHAAPAHVRLDRRARGLAIHAVHAARTEAEAHAIHRRLHPADRFLFETPPALAQGEPEKA
ncbi:MAG: hypothetical protein RIR62_1067 [Pseudomonadota bacterium]|jgi:hypothetical protein